MKNAAMYLPTLSANQIARLVSEFLLVDSLLADLSLTDSWLQKTQALPQKWYGGDVRESLLFATMQYRTWTLNEFNWLINKWNIRTLVLNSN